MVDYGKGDAQIISDVKAAVKAGVELRYCFDAVSERNSFQNMSHCLSKTGAKITLVHPRGDNSAIPEYVETSQTMVGDVHGPQPDFGQAWFTLFSKGLPEGWFKAHLSTVVPGGLHGVEEGSKRFEGGQSEGDQICVPDR